MAFFGNPGISRSLSVKKMALERRESGGCHDLWLCCYDLWETEIPRVGRISAEKYFKEKQNFSQNTFAKVFLGHKSTLEN